MATKKISLFDTTQGILVEVNVSAVVAQRAVADPVFATLLKDKVLKVHPQPLTSDEADGTSDVMNEEFVDSDDTGHLNLENQKTEVSLYRWSPPSILFLLETYMKMEQDFNSGKFSLKKVWENISGKLKERGYDVTGLQCASKIRNLKKTYKSIKEHNSVPGNDKRTWRYFDVMEKVVDQTAWLDSITVASVIQAKRKTIIECLLEKKLKQKEDHEQQKMIRHKERMELDEKFLDVLKKLADN